MNLATLLLPLGLVLPPPPIPAVPVIEAPRSVIESLSAPQPAREPTRRTADDSPRWPLDPRPEVVAGFSPPAVAWHSGHRGVDLLGTPGQPVRSALGGTVTFAGSIAGRGVVVVSHGQLRTTYEPVQPGVGVGEQVNPGAVLGELQAGRSHCPPRACLHWGLLEGETYLDPLSLLGAGPVRLLPQAD